MTVWHLWSKSTTVLTSNYRLRGLFIHVQLHSTPYPPPAPPPPSLPPLSSSSETSASLRPTRRTPGWWGLWWRAGTGATGTPRRDSRRSAPSSSRATRRARRCERRTFLRAVRSDAWTHTQTRLLRTVCLSLNPQICYTISLAKDITEAKKVSSHLMHCLECYGEKCQVQPAKLPVKVATMHY